MAIATYLDKDGYDVHIVSGAERLYLERVKKYLEEDLICIGISSMTGFQITQGVEIAKLVRQYKKSLPIVWGGYHPTIYPSQTIESQYVDYAVRGYGERTFYELVQALENGDPCEGIQGLTYRQGDEIIFTPERPIEPVDNFPIMPYHLVDFEEFYTAELGNRTMAYISSRGCPNNCFFCSDKVVYKRRWNALPAERVLDELEFFKERYNFDSVRLNDPNFFVNEKRVKAFCEGVIKRKLDIKWGRVNGSAEVLIKYSPGTWELMQRAGLFSILVGAESGYQVALDRINKKATREQLEELSRLANKHRIRVIYSFMLGIPLDFTNPARQRTEFSKELSETLSFMDSLIKSGEGFARPILFRYTPYPGTELYNEAKMNGWDEPGSLEEWSTLNIRNTEKVPWLTEEEVTIIDSLISLLTISKHSAEMQMSLWGRIVKILKRLYRYFILRKSL